MSSETLKKSAIQIMLASLIGAAGIAVFAVLIGEFNDVLGKALLTLFLVTLHALLSLAYIDHSSKRTSQTLTFFSNTIFVLLVLSFITSVFGVWGLFPGEMVGRLYGTYFVIAFAALHGEMLYGVTGKTSGVDKIVYTNYIFMALVIGLLLPIIWVDSEYFGDFYYRGLAAAGIVDATLTIVAVILHKLYLQKHPEETSQLFTYAETVDEFGNPVKVKVEEKRRGLHPLLWVLIIFLGFQVIGSVLFAIIGMVATR